ncbi:MAG: TauD/TfdA family dioxygenase [Acidimicrobiales bacterium]
MLRSSRGPARALSHEDPRKADRARRSPTMHNAVSFDQVMAAAAAVSTTFENFPADPVSATNAGTISASARAEVVDRYERHGFAVIQLDPHRVTAETLLALAESFDLGAPFVPPLYATNGKPVATVARISAAAADVATARHPSFERTVGLALHCDGTLQEIGFVKVSVLLCEAPAAQGGETILFNASAAYAQLAAVDAPAAAALATPGALIRQANINGCRDVNAGPAFTVQEHQLVCGYSVTATDRWSVPVSVAEADLYRGVGFLLHASLPGSPHFAELALEAGQAIVFDNTRISHGRTSYCDNPSRPRCLYRSLHLRHPSVRQLHTITVAARVAVEGSHPAPATP